MERKQPSADTSFHLGMSAIDRISGLLTHKGFFHKYLAAPYQEDVDQMVDINKRMLERAKEDIQKDDFEDPEQRQHYIKILDWKLKEVEDAHRA